jgi:nicotinate-nucleotide adenylyltransferase
MEAKKKNIGLFFGSFNPIHIGHLVIAEYMAEYTPLEQVWFVVSPLNPLKQKESLLPEGHRITLVRMAIEYDTRFQVSNIEFDLPKPSYTFNTLVHLHEKYPQYNFSLIMGMDNLLTLNKWKNYEELLKNYNIYVYPRNGNNELPDFSKHSSVILTDAPVMGISSSMIRKAIADKKNMRHILPPGVGQYIKEMHFYEKRKPAPLPSPPR